MCVYIYIYIYIYPQAAAAGTTSSSLGGVRAAPGSARRPCSIVV